MTSFNIVTDDEGVAYRGGPAWKEVDAQEVAREFKNVAASVEGMFTSAEGASEKLLVSSIEVTLVISATGKLGILGTGVEGKAEAGFKVTFARK
jgi:hypothetical protein